MKKQIAVLMAAATAVTTVAPVLANAEVKEVNGVTASEVSAKIKEALNVRYADKTQDGIKPNNSSEVDDYLNSRYAVFVSVNDNAPAIVEGNGLKAVAGSVYEGKFFEGVDLSKVAIVTDANKVVKIIEKESINSTGKVKVFIVDKGIKDNSSIFKTNKKVYVKGDADETDTEVSIKKTYEGIKDKKFVDSIDYVKDSNETKIELKLKSGEKLNFGEGNEAYDFEKALDKNGKSLVLDDSADQSVYDQVAKFEMKDNADGKMYSFDLPSGDTVVYSVDDAEKATIEMSDVFTEDTGYTKKGADFVNKLINANNDINEVTFNHAGVTYKLRNPLNFGDAKIEKDGDKYVLKFTADVTDKNNNVDKILKFVIEGKTQKDLARVLKDFKAGKEVVAGYFTKLAGSNRYATAIEISREAFKKNDSADTVVIVGGNALMDGLSAGPLASAKNAPILLADAKSGLNNDTINEIDRACDNLKNKTVYIVGGDSSVPKSVEKQLKDKFGAVVVRISGKDRYETSLDVARRLGYEKVLETGTQGNDNEKGNIYFVGGEGAADAMSIAGVASKFAGGKVDGPIVVVPKNEISRKTRDFISSKYFKKAYFIGGDGNLSTNVYKTPGLAKEKERVSGKDRFETNVEILNKFYGSNPAQAQVQGAIFTSGDNNYLVDAQTSAVLSVGKKAPIVLTGKKLTDSQVDLFKDNAVLSKANVNKNVYQVGGVVSADVMKVVVDKLGL